MMAVFTPLTTPELEEFLAAYACGTLQGYEGIGVGSENSNFRLRLSGGSFILTLIERGLPHTLSVLAVLLDDLAAAGLPVPVLCRDRNDRYQGILAGRAAILQPCLPGQHANRPTPAQCHALGGFLARMHLATCDFAGSPAERGWHWVRVTGAGWRLRLPREARCLLDQALESLEALVAIESDLPQAQLHADLFRDNALFEGARLTGVIDFHNTQWGPQLYDLAVAVNDWCHPLLGLDTPHNLQALLGGYAELRPLTPAEVHAWPLLLQVAALRFWLSRLLGVAQGSAAAHKSPLEFERILSLRLQHPVPALPLCL